MGPRRCDPGESGQWADFKIADAVKAPATHGFIDGLEKPGVLQLMSVAIFRAWPGAGLGWPGLSHLHVHLHYHLQNATVAARPRARRMLFASETGCGLLA